MVVDKLNRPFKDIRISVIDRCNFRCPYCMPAEIFGEDAVFSPKSHLLTFEEIVRLMHIFVKLGASKVRLTGGEPLLRRQVSQLVAMLTQIGGIKDIAMTTNGYLLPQYAQKLRNVGLHRISVSLDSLDEIVFQQMNGQRSTVQDVIRGIDAATNAGFKPIKINTVVQKGVNDHTILDLVRYCKEHGHIIRFIEYMDVGTRNNWKLKEVVPSNEIIARINNEIPLQPIQAKYGDVATRYAFADGDGEIGVISSVTQPFCGDCTRLRLSPEGKIYTCLFGVQGVDLRSPLREGMSDEGIEDLITQTWKKRRDRYSEMRSSVAKQRRKVEMYHIGG